MSWEFILGIILFSVGAIGLLIKNINWRFVKTKIKECK